MLQLFSEKRQFQIKVSDQLILTDIDQPNEQDMTDLATLISTHQNRSQNTYRNLISIPVSAEPAVLEAI